MNTKDKTAIRKELINKRSLLNSMDLERAERSLHESFFPWTVFKQAKVIMAYVSFRNEFPTEGLIKSILASGKTLVLPHTDDSMEIAPYAVSDISTLKSSSLGILEPNTLSSPLVNPFDIQLVIVPGVGFDRKGNRLGFGKGCYDKFLPLTNSKCVKVGLCYEFQLLDDIPTGPHDVKMDQIFTENGFHKVE